MTTSDSGLVLSQIHAPLHFFASLLSPAKSLKHTLLPSTKSDKLVYIQLVQSSGFSTKRADKGESQSSGGGGSGSGPVIKISSGAEEVILGEGDGVFIRGGKVGEELVLENVGKGLGEVVLFEMDA